MHDMYEHLKLLQCYRILIGPHCMWSPFLFVYSTLQYLLEIFDEVKLLYFCDPGALRKQHQIILPSLAILSWSDQMEMEVTIEEEIDGCSLNTILTLKFIRCWKMFFSSYFFFKLK